MPRPHTRPFSFCKPKSTNQITARALAAAQEPAEGQGGHAAVCGAGHAVGAHDLLPRAEHLRARAPLPLLLPRHRYGTRACAQSLVRRRQRPHVRRRMVLRSLVRAGTVDVLEHNLPHGLHPGPQCPALLARRCAQTAPLQPALACWERLPASCRQHGDDACVACGAECSLRSPGTVAGRVSSAAAEEPGAKGASAQLAGKSQVWRGTLHARPGSSTSWPRSLRMGQYSGAVIDAPWSLHAPKLILWCAAQDPMLVRAGTCLITSQGSH